MQRMSELFSRWVEGAMSSALRSASTSSEEETVVRLSNQSSNEIENDDEEQSNPSQNANEEINETTPLLSHTISENQSTIEMQRINQETQVTDIMIDSENESDENRDVQESDSELHEGLSETPEESADNLPASTNTTTHTDAEVNFTDEFKEQLQQAHSSRSRNSIERQFAASKIQSFIRLHKERQRELKLMNAYKPSFIYTPEAKNVYKGHRNARTMVCRLISSFLQLDL